jgi:type IV fimbrial biogenesis protein FimT
VLRSRLHKGFTLIEAVVTVSVMALLMALMAPSMAEWIRSTHVRNLSESLQDGLQKARMEALKRNKVVTFWLVTSNSSGLLDDTCALATNSGSWVISLEDPSSLCSHAPSATAAPQIVEAYGAGNNAASISVQALASDYSTAASSVSFNGFGQTVPSATSLAFIKVTHTQSGARRLRVSISPAGAVRMCDTDVPAGATTACTDGHPW